MNKRSLIIALVILFVIGVIALVAPSLQTNEPVSEVPVQVDDATGPVGLSPDECEAMGGYALNTVAGDVCGEDEAYVGDVVGFISPNICCITSETIAQIDDFVSCAAAGFPLLESYPMKCVTPDDRMFVQEIEGLEE